MAMTAARQGGGSSGAGFACALALLLAFLLLLAPGRAEAAVANCTLSSSGLVFSPYNSQLKLAVDGAATITVTCSGNGSANNLSLNITGGNGGSCSVRRLAAGTLTLGYQLYRDAARLLPFCDGAQRLDVDFDFSTGNSQTRTVTVYGRVFAGQNPGAGTWTDMMTVSLKQGGNTLTSTMLAVSQAASPSCAVTAGTLGFGTYNAAAPTLASAAVTVNCSSGAAYQVSLGAGNNAASGARRMTGPAGALLAYALYRDSARTVAWGDGTALGARVSGTGTGAAQSLTVYGRIPAAQTSAAGAYSDSVVVTVEY